MVGADASEVREDGGPRTEGWEGSAKLLEGDSSGPTQGERRQNERQRELGDERQRAAEGAGGDGR